MFKKALLVSLFAFAVNAQAHNSIVNLDFSHLAAIEEVQDWVPGDKAEYNMAIGTFLKGKMSMEVLAFNGSELSLRQILDLQIMKQDCELVIDMGTGEIKKMVCNGQDQNPGQQDVEIIDSKAETVTVPAGTFDTTWIKAREKNQNTVSEQWITQEVPVMGMVKMASDSQMGKVTAELTSFVKK